MRNFSDQLAKLLYKALSKRNKIADFTNYICIHDYHREITPVRAPTLIIAKVENTKPA
jgi:hypothetical protein